MSDSNFDNPDCPLDDIAAYLDGELGGQALANFETHLQSCKPCARQLLEQRLLLSALQAALSDSRSIELPRDFTRVVTTHAESDFSGMRRQSERWKALKVCGVLGLFSFALLGATCLRLVFEPIRSFTRIAKSVLELTWHTAYELGTAAVVIVRVSGGAIISEPHGLRWLALIFLFSIFLLPLLIVRYHRAQIIE